MTLTADASASSTSIVDLDCLTDPRWAAVAPTRRNELFMDPRWYQALNDTYGLTFRAKVVLDGDTIVAALPYSEVADQRGERVVSLPFCDLVDAPASEEHWPALIASLDVGERPLKITTPAEHPASSDPSLDTELDAVYHRLAVGHDDEELLMSYSTTTRQRVRQATKKGLTFRATTDRASLADFHRLHVGVRKYRHHMLAQPYSLFEHIAERFFDDGQGTIIRADADGEMVGGCILLHSGDALHYKFSVSHPDYRNKGVSHGGLHAAALHARDAGATWLDLGCSDFADEGLVDFKRRFSPEEYPLATHTRGRLEQNAFSRSVNALVAAAVEPELPDSLAAAAGDTLYRFFA